MGRATSNPLCEAALAYAGHGWHVFPCGPDKKPLSTNGLNDATTDAEQIERWWARWPHALIGCACGPSGFWVLDLDPPEGEASLQALIRQHGGFRETRAARTGRGGRHLYWEMSGKRVRNSAGKIGPNIDVRGDGGYVILPPSEASTGAYAWVDPYAPIVQAPTWLVTAALDANSKTRESRPNGHAGMNGFEAHAASVSDTGRYVQAAIDAECSAIVSARVGQQNQILNDAALKIGSLLAGNPGAVRRSDARERLINAGLAMANDSSREAWTREIVAKAVDHGLEDGEANPRPKPGSATGGGAGDSGKAADPIGRFRLVPFGELVPSTQRTYLIKGLMPRRGLVLVWGPPKCGKSFWCFDAMLHVALGWMYRGRRVQQGHVVYGAFEGQDGFNIRAEAFRLRHLAKHTGDVPLSILPVRIRLVDDHPALIAAIRAQMPEGVKPAAVVLDTLNRSIGGSENSDEDMGAYIEAADAIKEAFDCAVIVVHHCGIEGTRPRGHTSMTGAVDAQIAVARSTNSNGFTATVEFMKDGPEGDVIASRLEAVTVGADADGDPLTSCVVVETDGVHPASGLLDKIDQAKASLEDTTREFYSALTDALSRTEAGPRNGVRMVHREIWIEELRRLGILDKYTEKSSATVFWRHRKRLKEAGLIVCDHDFTGLVK